MATPPTTVLLPTVEWTEACDEVAGQLGAEDELLVVCDHATDPVASRETDLPGQVRIVTAGEPEGCSGKANAVAVGMAAARHDRIVWTDDDFHHPPDWLASLLAAYDRHGPVSEVPCFVGRDPLAWLLEPQYAWGGTLGVYAGDVPWAGALAFERSDLDVEAFLEDLERSVSDDGLLAEHLEFTTLRRVRTVGIGGSLRQTAERHARFVQIVWHHDRRNTVVSTVGAGVLGVVTLLFPLVGLAVTTALTAAVYAFFGVSRWTVLLSYPSFLLVVPGTLYGLARRTFVWGGRRYRWASTFDVSIVE